MRNIELFAQCKIRSSHRFRNLERNIKIFNFFSVLALSCLATGCANFGSKKSEGAHPDLTSRSKGSAETRDSYLGTRIVLRFKAGNTRRGILRETQDERYIVIEGGSDTGIYALDEILEIETYENDPRRLYP